MQKRINWSRRISAAILCFLLVVVLSPVLQAQSSQDLKPTDTYDYPVKPGTEEWQAFTSHAEMLEACQIPEAILRDMTTEGLVETALDYQIGRAHV